MNAEPVPCPSCEAPLTEGDEFCAACGVAVAAESAVPPPAPARPKSSRAGRYSVERRRGKMKSASTWLLVLAGLFVLGGTVGGLIAKGRAKDFRRHWEGSAPDTLIELEGEIYTLEELGRLVDLEVKFTFLANYFLAITMAGVYFWARRQPFPALVTAFLVYAAVVIVSVLVDPANLVRGMLLKVVTVMVLLTGIRAAFQERVVKAHLATAGAEPARPYSRRRR